MKDVRPSTQGPEPSAARLGGYRARSKQMKRARLTPGTLDQVPRASHLGHLVLEWWIHLGRVCLDQRVKYGHGYDMQVKHRWMSMLEERGFEVRYLQAKQHGIHCTPREQCKEPSYN